MSTPLNDSYSNALLSWLPATTSPTEDAKGLMSWTSTGTPTVGYDRDIGLDAINFDGNSAVYTSQDYYLTSDLQSSTTLYSTFDFWIKTDPATPQDSVAFALSTKYVTNSSTGVSKRAPFLELCVSPDSMKLRFYNTEQSSSMPDFGYITAEYPIPVIPADKPHHFTLTYSTSANASLYIDDLPVITFGSPSKAVNWEKTISLGCSYKGSGNGTKVDFFKGAIAGFNISRNTASSYINTRYKKGFDAYTDSPSSAQSLRLSTCRGFRPYPGISCVSHLDFENNCLDTNFGADYPYYEGEYGRYWGTKNGYNNGDSDLSTTTDTKYAVSGKAWNSSNPNWIAIDCDIANDPYTPKSGHYRQYSEYVPFHLDGSKPFVFDFWWSCSSTQNKCFFCTTVYGSNNDTTKIGETLELWYNNSTRKIVFKMFPTPIQQYNSAFYAVNFNFSNMSSLCSTKHRYTFVLVPNRYVRMYVDGVPLTADNDAPPPPFEAQSFFINTGATYKSGSAQNPSYTLISAALANQGYYDEIRIFNGDAARAPYQVQSLRAGTSREAFIPIPISGQAWYPLYSDPSTFGWLSADSTTHNEGYLDDGDSNVTIWITSISAISGDTTAVTATLASGCAVSDVTVTGAGVFNLTLTVDGTPYLVNSSGKLYYLPEFGLMSKADKHKMNWLPVENIITGAHTVSGGIALTNFKGETVCTLETGTQ